MPPKKNSCADSINQPKILALPLKTYYYGETPAFICREQFEDMAKHLGITVEDLAKDILNKSLGDQLCMLRDFYKRKNEEAETVFNPLIDVCNERGDAGNTPTKSRQLLLETKEKTPEEKTKQQKRPRRVSVVRTKRKTQTRKNPIEEGSSKQETRSSPPQNKFTLPQNNDIEVHDTEMCEKTANNTKEPTDDALKESIGTVKTHLSLMKTNELVEEDPSMTRHVLGSTSSDTKAPTGDTVTVTNSAEEDLETFLFGTTLNKRRGPPKKRAYQPPAESLIDKDHATNKASVAAVAKETQEDLEGFLFGESPHKRSRPSYKKTQCSEASEPSINVSNEKMSPKRNECHSPPSTSFATPGLAFDLKQCSPSRQRNLLLIARDIAELQKNIAAGKKPSGSVTESISFISHKD